VPYGSLPSRGLAPLEIKRPLVLQPPPVVVDTADLLAVVVGHWVRHGGGRRVDAVFLDAVVELAFFLESPLALIRRFLSHPFPLVIHSHDK
jgi:hypothetical protein